MATKTVSVFMTSQFSELVPLKTRTNYSSYLEFEIARVDFTFMNICAVMKQMRCYMLSDCRSRTAGNKIIHHFGSPASLTEGN